ncbi:MAG: hypothetical protein AUH89_04055 [Ktedonobacter sp. 13_1_40CM_4_52_4]|nr:MAG: hypothetical protein AUH89_04055 [Ktedonobacter sp. 13_1_40CM_4_52_4]
MGVERAVTRWHIQQQQIQQEITTLEAKLAATRNEQETADIRRQLSGVRKKLLALGPCPKPMMG